MKTRRKRIRPLLLGLLAALLGLGLTNVASAQLASPRRVTFHADGASLRTAVARILAGTGVRCEFAPAALALAEGARVTAHLEGIPLGTALGALLSSAGRPLSLRGEGAAYRVVPAAVSYDYKDVPLARALGEFFGDGYAVPLTPETLRPVTVTARSLPFDLALRRLLDAAGPGRLAWEMREGVHVVRPVAPAPPGADAGTRSRKVSARLEGVPLRAALYALFRAAGLSYTLEGGVADTRVHLEEKEGWFTSVLEGVLRTSGQPLTYTIENNVWHLVLRRGDPDVENTDMGQGR